MNLIKRRQLPYTSPKNEAEFKRWQQDLSVMLDDIVRFGNSMYSLTSPVFRSAEQTITSAGQIILPHGLVGVTDPALIQIWVYIKNLTAEAGYSQGDMLLVPACQTTGAYTYPNLSGTQSTIGLYIVPDATNLTGRFANQGTTGMWFIANKTTGVSFGITNANWSVIIVAKYATY